MISSNQMDRGSPRARTHKGMGLGNLAESYDRWERFDRSLGADMETNSDSPVICKSNMQWLADPVLALSNRDAHFDLLQHPTMAKVNMSYVSGAATWRLLARRHWW